MAFLVVEPRSVRVPLAENLCDLGWAITSFEDLCDREVGRAPFELYLGVCLTTEEKHGKPQSG
jgi:hypothetical protein